jgi:hypothetical protein
MYVSLVHLSSVGMPNYRYIDCFFFILGLYITYHMVGESVQSCDRNVSHGQLGYNCPQSYGFISSVFVKLKEKPCHNQIMQYNNGHAEN